MRDYRCSFLSCIAASRTLLALRQASTPSLTLTMASGVQVTVRGSANIAVIKYWGKRDEKLNLPINSSLSGTLDQEQLSTVTTAYTAAELVEDELYINNERQPVSSNRRLVACLDALRAAAIAKHHDGGDALSPSWKLRIVSRNNFPTAAGLASSASGFCCLGTTDRSTN